MISNQNEVLAVSAECGNDMGLQDFSCLLHNDQSWLELLQDLSVFGCPCGGHANDFGMLEHTQILTAADFSKALCSILIDLLSLESFPTKVNLISQHPEAIEWEIKRAK